MMAQKLKGSAYSKKEYAYKKKHPIKWWIKDKWKKLIRWLNADML